MLKLPWYSWKFIKRYITLIPNFAYINQIIHSFRFVSLDYQIEFNNPVFILRPITYKLSFPFFIPQFLLRLRVKILPILWIRTEHHRGGEPPVRTRTTLGIERSWRADRVAVLAKIRSPARARTPRESRFANRKRVGGLSRAHNLIAYSWPLYCLTLNRLHGLSPGVAGTRVRARRSKRIDPKKTSEMT